MRARVHRLLGQDLDAIKLDVSFNKEVHGAFRDRNFEPNLCRDLASAVNGEASKIDVRNLNTRYVNVGHRGTVPVQRTHVCLNAYLLPACACVSANTATIVLHMGVCGGNMTPFDAARLLMGQVSEVSSPLRKGR